MGTNNEQFVFDCMGEVERLLKKRPHLTFSFMLEKVWERVGRRWTRGGFTREKHCKAALGTLIDQKIIKRIGEETIGNKTIPRYALKAPRENHKPN